jgi:serine/threonine protein kinase
MEYIEGAPPRGPLAPPAAIRLALGIAAALEAAHERGITHGDLKPANVLVTQSGLKLFDFGLALVNDNSGVDIADAPTALSVAGAVMGTVAYMSPEQAQGKPARRRASRSSLRRE